MQSTPTRLSQTIWSTFRAAKPVSRRSFVGDLHSSKIRQTSQICSKTRVTSTQITQRWYSEDRKVRDLDQKVESAQERIKDALGSRAEAAFSAEPSLRRPEHETIVHARPESSSIVHTKASVPDTPQHEQSKTAPVKSEHKSQLPSQKASGRSQLSSRFSSFMDKFQSNIFVASQRINDLTGYTGIERLKREIDMQETQVQNARQMVKSNRAKYAEAITMRSATQREVNDLLHRKHAWSPQDLERFTNLYRSDHANEQSEQKAHQALSEAEVKYEEASTQLAKSILARYHEEQIWSDKIRQMSTWGTWGLMGLNVLLFIVLQMAIEPWRRRRLVKGFEEKVEVALAAREQENQDLRVRLREMSGNEVIADATAFESEDLVTAAGEQLAEAIADAVSGSTDDSKVNRQGVVQAGTIEAAAEHVTDQELQVEQSKTKPAIISRTSSWKSFPSSIYASVKQSCNNTYQSLIFQFDSTDHVVLSRLQLTTKVLEGMAAGMALTGAAIYAVTRGR